MTTSEKARTILIDSGVRPDQFTPGSFWQGVADHLGATLEAALTVEKLAVTMALGKLADMANTCTRCGDWFYTPEGAIPHGCEYCKPIRALLPPWAAVVATR